MRRRTIQLVGITLTLVLVVSAAGCGGSKKSSAPPTTTTEATTTTTTEATTTTTTSSEATTTTTSPATTTSGTGSFANAANCKQLSDLGTQFSQAITGAKGDLAKQATLFKALADKTPEEIRPDFETIADAYSKIAGDLKGVDLSSGKVPDAATLAKITKLGAEFSGPKFTQAIHNIEAWVTKNCNGG
jgi:hypothetical protein